MSSATADEANSVRQTISDKLHFNSGSGRKRKRQTKSFVVAHHPVASDSNSPLTTNKNSTPTDAATTTTVGHLSSGIVGVSNGPAMSLDTVIVSDSDGSASSECDKLFRCKTLRSAARMAAKAFEITTPVALQEFRRLMELKAFVCDTDDTKLQSSLIMDAMWQRVIVDTKFYVSLQKCFGCTMHRVEYIDDAEYDSKCIAMTTLYTLRYGSPPLAAWDNVIYCSDSSEDSDHYSSTDSDSS